MEDLTVMVVDGSARAHVISDAYERSPNVKRIIVTPGNDFIGWNRRKEVIVVPADLKKPETILEVARKYRPHLTDVCQDDALAAGTVDVLEASGFAAFGPTKAAAKIEWDKGWSRDFMRNNGIPYPSYERFSNEVLGRRHVDKIYEKDPNAFIYVKAGGLVAGKGAIPARNVHQALGAVNSMSGFGEAGNEFVIEEGMIGEEVSGYAFCDGENYLTTKEAQDHKTINPHDEGKNTGGMGAYTNVSLVTPKVRSKIRRLTIEPVIKGMNNNGTPYMGVLYQGLMIDENGNPRVVEYNARFGAPESEVIVPGIKTPMDQIAFAAREKRLSQISLEEDGRTRLGFVGASRGYPDDYSNVRGKRIHGLERAMDIPGVSVFSYGIAVRDGKFYANGGRLFIIVAEGDNICEARELGLEAMGGVFIEGNNLHFRHDIGWREVQRFYESKE
ncbi:phosphoribosylamine--glycine ligase [Candidatus Pacearchaeota archaeon]|nr:phosphoribosylamine--glycine ligase [Candidatus Pacearchaeota archaeon]